MPETLLFLTELLGLPVYDLKGRRIGRVRDSAAGYGRRTCALTPGGVGDIRARRKIPGA